MAKKSSSNNNQSTAVMARKHKAQTTAQLLDFFPTPAWSTRGLLEFLKDTEKQILRDKTVLEPAFGLGHMAQTLGEEFKSVSGADIHDWGAELGPDKVVMPDVTPVIHDFLRSDFPLGKHDWVISNPPFSLCEEFSAKAFDMCRVGSAMLMRAAFLESKGRYENLLAVNPPNIMLCHSTRLGMVAEEVKKDAASATFHCFFIWLRDPATGERKAGRCEIDWIKPDARKRLERDSDYPAEKLPDMLCEDDEQ